MGDGRPDLERSDPASIAYVIGLFNTLKPLSAGVDMDTYIVPIVVLDDFSAYGPPVANVNVPDAFEQPGYRKLMQSAEAIRDELRAGGAGITLEGNIATSALPAISRVWLNIDNKTYQGMRIVVQAQQRRPRQATP